MGRQVERLFSDTAYRVCGGGKQFGLSLSLLTLFSMQREKQTLPFPLLSPTNI